MSRFAAGFCFSATAVLVAVLTLPAASAAADDGSSSNGSAAMRVYRDPVTGEFTAPPAPQPGRAAEPVAPAPPPLVIVPNPNGGGKARLGEPYAHTSRATKDASGKTILHCERGAGAARE